MRCLSAPLAGLLLALFAGPSHSQLQSVVTFADGDGGFEYEPIKDSPGDFDIRVDNITTPLPAAPVEHCTSFDSGDDGWVWGDFVGSAGGVATVESAGGNPAFHLRTQHTGIASEIVNNSSAFAIDFTAVPTVALSFDIKVEEGEGVRPLIVEIRDYSDPIHYISVLYFDWSLSDVGAGWQTFTVAIDDTKATDLPPGWVGTGVPDPMAPGGSVLPPGVTFADVLAGADQVVITTNLLAGMLPVGAMDLRFDNICLSFPSLFEDGFESGDTTGWQ